ADPRHQRTIAKTVRGGLERIQAHQLLQSGNCQDQERCTEAVREARRSQAHGPLRVPSLLCWKIPINAARALPPEHASGGRAQSALPPKRTPPSRHGTSSYWPVAHKRQNTRRSLQRLGQVVGSRSEFSPTRIDVASASYQTYPHARTIRITVTTANKLNSTHKLSVRL